MRYRSADAFVRLQWPINMTRRLFSSNHDEIYTPILIVGGGPSGLFLSRLLDSYGTPSTVLEASSSTTSHPQAHFLNTRSMEIMRHSLPGLYRRVRQAMPPVQEWSSFYFGHSMKPPFMAHVIHPVDQPLLKDADANGKLVEAEQATRVIEPSLDEPLSVCTVGHLAQHTFCKLLAESEASSITSVNYNVSVVEVTYEDGLHRVSTRNGTTFVTPVVVAADGAHSALRKLWSIPMQGQEAIQHLINVHIRVDKDDNLPPAMLYSIFNKHLLGMMVRHSQDEYVLQIPYFPPYQTMERNFTPSKVHAMVDAALCGSQFAIESIRPWTMGSLVASRYHNGHGGVLVGDAAHVFPPAGGFGMNTGLQDVHNLAWRLALWYENPSAVNLSSMLSKYAEERRPVAQRNTALSVRNYQRILELSRACYLNDHHPATLIQLLGGMALLPLSTRQTMFQTLLETAMWPLSLLETPSNFHARHITQNVRQILRQGGGLPLLFPKYELGFGYGDKGSSSDKNEDASQDSISFTPQLKVGRLLPHVELEVLNYSSEAHPNVQLIPETAAHITSCDLPAQLRMNSPCFALLILNAPDTSIVDNVRKAMESVVANSGVDVRLVQVLDSNHVTHAHECDLVVREVGTRLSSMLATLKPVLILIRPDGHVASVTRVEGGASDSHVAPALLQSLLDALGGGPVRRAA